MYLPVRAPALASAAPVEAGHHLLLDFHRIVAQALFEALGHVARQNLPFARFQPVKGFGGNIFRRHLGRRKVLAHIGVHGPGITATTSMPSLESSARMACVAL